MKTQLSVLTEEQILSIHQTTKDILKNTGVWMTQPEALSILKKADCIVKDNIVYIPPELVDWAVSKAPAFIQMYDRNGKPVMNLGGRNTYYGPGPTCPHFSDTFTEKQRLFTYADAKDGSILLDALPNIDFIMSFAQFSDVPAQYADRYEFEVMVKNCTKPIVFLARSKEGVKDIIDMAAAVRGGYEQLKAAPFAICYPEPLSPLKHPDDALDKLLVAAEYGMPLIYTPCTMAGATAPATLAGMIAQASAETISGLVVAQLKNPGTGFITGGVISIMDMAVTQLPYGCPEMQLSLAAYADLARYLGMPVFGTAGCSDAKIVDQQAALESASTILMAEISGSNLVHDVGYIESGLTFSFNMMVLGDEVIAMARRIGRGIEVNKATLAKDVIDSVGPGGNFLAEDHTLEHYRNEHWMPSLIDRSNRDNWLSGGQLTFGDKTKLKIKNILETHKVDPLPEKVILEINKIMKVCI